MPINIGANFAYNGKLPNFERDRFATKDAMKAFPETSIDDGHLSYCAEDGNTYQFKSSNSVDAATGKWRVFKADVDVDAELNGTSTNPIQNKAVFEALKAKADVVALGAYQPKYNADYVATKDFNYSDVPDDVNMIDLNGYTMSVSATDLLVGASIMNGMINVAVDAEIASTNFKNVSISSTDSSTEAYTLYTLTNVNADNCVIFKATIKDYSSLTYCNILQSIIDNNGIYYSYLINCQFKPHSNNYYVYINNCIENTVIRRAIVTESGRVIEAGFESNIATPTLPGNAPSCEAVKTALQLKADKTQLNDLATKTELNSKADASALGAYQPKYKADYVATKDFNYSELPADEELSIKVDLNGYKMSVSVDRTIVRGKYYNGIIDIDSNQVELSGVYSDNVRILSSAEGVDQCKIGEACNFRNSELTNVLLTADCEFHNCNISSSVINSFLFIEFSVISECTFGTDIDNLARIRNSIIDNVTYHIAVIKDGKPIDKGYESNIDSPTISGNAPSCEAVTTKLANYATKTELNSKADASELDNYTTTATTNTISADVTLLMNEVFVLTATASVSPNIAEVGTSKAVNVSVDAKLGKSRTQVDEITIDGTKYTGEIPYTHSATATTTHTYNITVKKGTKTADASATINFYNASYYGAVDASKTSLTATEVKALKTKEVKSGRSGTRTFNLTNQKACIAYPQSFGAAASIKDANGFDYLASYIRTEVTIDGEAYYVYLLSSLTTITDFKQIIN